MDKGARVALFSEGQPTAPACRLPSTIEAICSSTSSTSGDRSMPPTSGSTPANRHQHRRAPSAPDHVSHASGFAPRTARRRQSPARSARRSTAAPAQRRPESAPQTDHRRRPASSHSSDKLSQLQQKSAPPNWPCPSAPTAGTTRRSGSTSQSVSAKTKRPSGLPERADMGMRWYCMYSRNKQAPASNPDGNFKQAEK